ncbi:MAG TPA: hypothetical protein VGU20_21855 [Stellaceae bacterium]|nr:hypothetical protein [Stellaceae bacterium]
MPQIEKHVSAFLVVFLAVIAITIASGAALFLAAHFWAQPTPSQQSTMQSMDFAWKAGVGAILALLGVKRH